MRKNYRTKSYTTRTTKITKTGIERLRATQLKKAKSYKQQKFLKSSQFDKLIRQNIKENRIKVNTRTLTQISKLGRTQQQKETLIRLFGEKTTRAGGKVRRVNTLTSQKQTERLRKISKELNRGKFNAKKYITRSKSFRERRKYLPKNASLMNMLDVVNSTQFYLEERKLIQAHNRNVQKYGTEKAQTMVAGNNLRTRYIESVSKEDEDLIKEFIKQSLI